MLYVGVEFDPEYPNGDVNAGRLRILSSALFGAISAIYELLRFHDSELMSLSCTCRDQINIWIVGGSPVSLMSAPSTQAQVSTHGNIFLTKHQASTIHGGHQVLYLIA